MPQLYRRDASTSSSRPLFSVSGRQRLRVPADLRRRLMSSVAPRGTAGKIEAASDGEDVQIGAISPDAGPHKGFIADFIYHTGLPVSSRGGGGWGLTRAGRCAWQFVKSFGSGGASYFILVP